MKITKDMSIAEILEMKGEKGFEILSEAGLHCVGCPMAQMESLKEGCVAHCIIEKDIDKIVEKLNKEE